VDTQLTASLLRAYFRENKGGQLTPLQFSYRKTKSIWKMSKQFFAFGEIGGGQLAGYPLISWASRIAGNFWSLVLNKKICKSFLLFRRLDILVQKNIFTFQKI